MLKHDIEPFYAQFPLPHGCQHLNIIRPCIDKLRQFITNQKHHHTKNLLNVISLQTKEILTFVGQLNLSSLIDQMGIPDNVAFQCLTENFC